MQYSEQISDAIYLLDSRVLYFGEKTGMVDENGTNRSYDWEKIDFNKEDEILRAVGMDPKDPELTSAVKPPIYVFGDEASYICRKATFGAGIFTPTGNVLDVSGETEKAFNNLVNALEKRGSNLSDMSNTFQGLIETINKTNGTGIK